MAKGLDLGPPESLEGDSAAVGRSRAEAARAAAVLSIQSALRHVLREHNEKSKIKQVHKEDQDR